MANNISVCTLCAGRGADLIAEGLPSAQVTWDRNGNLGKFTNFVNLLNMCGIAVPSGILRGACHDMENIVIQSDDV